VEIKKTNQLTTYLLCILSLSLFAFSSVHAISDSDYSAITQTNFNAHFYHGDGGLTIQPLKSHPEAYIKIDVINGTLDSQNAYIYFGENIGGKFDFVQNESTFALIQISFSDDFQGNVKVSNIVQANRSYIKLYPSADYDITWFSTLAPALPLMLICGIIGLVLLVAGPMYLINKLRQRDGEGLKVGIILCAVGFALTVAWIWS
jgi:hypothetical protein